MSLKGVIAPISAESVAKNQSTLINLRHVVALASGCAAGALRLESFTGFAFYSGITVASIMLLFILSGGRLSMYFERPTKALLWDGILGALPGYVLAWSLVYSLVET